MGNDGGVSRPVRHPDCLQRFRQRADLIDLNQDGIADSPINALRQALRIGDKQIVAHQLHPIAEGFRQQCPAFPVGLSHAVFQRNDGVFFRKTPPHCNHFIPAEHLIGFGQVIDVPVRIKPFRACRIYGDHEIFSGNIAGLFDRSDDQGQRVLVPAEHRRIASLVADARNRNMPLLQNDFQRMKDLGAAAEGFFPGWRRHRHDHEFLNVHVVGCMSAAVEDIHHGNRKHISAGPADIAIQADSKRLGGRLCAGKRNAKNGVRPQTALVGGAVQFDQLPIDGGLIKHIFARQRSGNFAVHMRNRPGNALPQIAGSVLIPQFAGFINSSGSAGRHGSASHDAVFQHYIHFNSRISSGVKDFAASDLADEDLLIHRNYPSLCFIWCFLL